MRLGTTTAKMRSYMWLTIDDPAVIEPILAHLELPGTRDGPQPSFSMTEAGVEQLALPRVTF